ncbi:MULTISPECIES: hypothetical protein [Bradyrhizobium]|jgi:hypothetical protein|uniref:hypothetical protein n=1 Tax=Bradyrhizobium TaxID=374 RepID=UPI00039EB509|nr:hypothetical protein [Bradyrhizobium denitrificans]MCL8489353.1 hypothetical protein [Bradyrhizobium denitrificans]
MPADIISFADDVRRHADRHAANDRAIRRSVKGVKNTALAAGRYLAAIVTRIEQKRELKALLQGLDVEGLAVLLNMIEQYLRSLIAEAKAPRPKRDLDDAAETMATLALTPADESASNDETFAAEATDGAMRVVVEVPYRDGERIEHFLQRAEAAWKQSSSALTLVWMERTAERERVASLPYRRMN